MLLIKGVRPLPHSNLAVSAITAFDLKIVISDCKEISVATTD